MACRPNELAAGTGEGAGEHHREVARAVSVTTRVNRAIPWAAKNALDRLMKPIAVTPFSSQSALRRSSAGTRTRAGAALLAPEIADYDAGFEQARPAVPVEALPSQSVVERFDVAVVPRRTRRMYESPTLPA